MAEKRFKVGDKVKIKKRLYGHEFKIGEIVTITEVYAFQYRADSENDFWYVSDDELYTKKYN